MKKQYVSPQCEYWCYITDDQLCSVGETLYAMARKFPSNPGGMHNSSAGSMQ